MTGLWRNWGFHSQVRIPGVRKFALVFEIDLRQWAIGFAFGSINRVCLLVGPFEVTLLRRCDCCP